MKPKLKYEDRNPIESLINGEPFFFVRARDIFALEALVGYISALKRFNHALSEPTSLNKNIVELEYLIKLFRTWQDNNHQLVRLPKSAN